MSRWPWLVVGTLAVTLVTTGGCSPGDDEKDTTPACATPVIPSGVPPTSASADKTTILAPSGGGLTVKETGFSTGTDGSRVSIGAVIENGTAEVAYRTRVIFRAFTADGKPAIAQSEQYQYFVEIPIIRPNEKVPVGDYVNIDPASFNQTGVRLKVAKAGLELVRTQWVPSADAKSFPEVTAKLDQASPPVARGGGVTVPIIGTSNACQDLAGRGIGVVFRDSGGAVVGGALDADRKPELCKKGEFRSRALTLNDKLPTADLTRTEVAVYCDVTGTDFGKTPGPDQPNN